MIAPEEMRVLLHFMEHSTPQQRAALADFLQGRTDVQTLRDALRQQ